MRIPRGLGRLGLYALAVTGSLLLLAGCEGSGGPPASNSGGSGGGTNGTLVLFAEDQLAANVQEFQLTISSATLTSSTGTVVPLVSAPVRLEWRSRGLAPTVVSATSLSPATYTQLSLTVDSPQMTVFDSALGTFSSLNPALTVSTVTLPVSLVVASGEVSGVRLHLDLESSVQLDTNLNFVIDPTFTLIPTSFIVGQLPGDIDDVLASVTSASGSQVVATVLSSGQSVTANTNAATLFSGVTGVSGLAAGDNIELDARLQSDGTYLAQEIEREVAGSATQLRGLVLARTPAVGDLTSFTLLVQEVAPTSASFSPGDRVTVTVDAGTGFRIAQEDLPTLIFPNLDFDRQTLQPGQFVHVVQRSGGGLVADDIALKEISLIGQVGLAVGVTSFDFVPDGDFFAQNNLGQISVVISSTASELENMPANLGSLQPNLSIVEVRGVLVFQGGSGVLIAKRVRLLQ